MKSITFASILVTKLLSNFTKSQFKEYFSQKIIKSIEKGNSPELYIIARKISPSTIDYTLADFIIDYPKYKDYKEKEFLFNLLSKGISIRQFSLDNNLGERGFLSAIKNGFDVCDNIGVLIATGNFSFSKEDFLNELSIFKIIIRDTYVKIIGCRNELEKFQTKYMINFDITSYKEPFSCLAFDGYIFKIIVYLQRYLH